ncbi:MAG: sporulation protein YunB [Clostridia bacterium]|nr:sporulation protein YunB [Clostridia bacterium]
MRRKRWKSGRKNKIVIRTVIIALIGILFLFFCDAKLRPQIRSIASVKACALAEQTVNDAVLKVLSSGDYASAVSVEKDSDSRVTAIKTDVLKINMMKAKVSKATASVLSGTERIVAIPAGSLTGLDILSGRGPAIRIKVNFTGFSEARVNSTFSGEGINQTVHRLMLTVNTTVYISLPDSKVTKDLSYEVCLAETVIVGNVPQLYADTN